jgi:cytochrome P450
MTAQHEAEPMSTEPFSPENVADPHPVYDWLRENSPVHRLQLPSGTPVWLVTRHEDARQALNDPRLSKDELLRSQVATLSFPSHVEARMNHHMLNADPPDHTRLRRLVSAAFTARRTEALRPRIQEITDQLLDELASAGEVDLLDAFAFPLPIQVICELLGVPLDDRDDFRRWSNAIVAGPQAGEELFPSATAMIDYIGALLERKRAEPADDLLTALIEVQDGGDRLTEGELSSMVFLLLIAGHETTVNLIGNGVHALLTHPDQLARLRAEPALLPRAVEEFLRFESPVETATFRITTEPVEFAGVTVPANQVLLVSLLAANRDGDRFPDADRLDIGRDGSQHVAFGHGIHYCLGAPLARLEGQIAIGSLLARFDRLELAVPAESLNWRPGVLLRGLNTLPVRLR